MVTQRLLVSIALANLLSLSGCSQPQVPVSDIVQSRKVAEQVLDAWKSGSAMEEMKSLSPAIIASEDLWRKKVKLDSYKFLDDGSMLGSNARFEIQLNYKEVDGKSMEKSFAYLVTTTPAITFFREER